MPSLFFLWMPDGVFFEAFAGRLLCLEVHDPFVLSFDQRFAPTPNLEGLKSLCPLAKMAALTVQMSLETGSISAGRKKLHLLSSESSSTVTRLANT
jgi:hypothetical protein